MRRILLLATAAAALAAGTVHAAPAAAATPCWKSLLNDWYDGRIDNTYPLHCYQDALKHLPADVQTYSSAHDDILRALQSAKARLQRSGTKVTGTTPIVPPKSRGGSASSGRGGTRTTPGGGTTTLPGRSSGKGFTHLVDKFNPSSPSSLPLPLLVLGALAILLVAAGAAGVLAKRFQGRKPAP
ncbi:MAG TPA: hypothetical protein VI408_11285 [Gaiellaceae bacterium]